MSRPAINRAIVRKLVKEVRALRLIAFKGARGDEFGAPLPTEAFGAGMWQDYLTPPAKHFFFTITADRNAVTLEIDTYSARFGRFHTAGDDFDVDAWDEGKLIITAAPANRLAYTLLQRAARKFLSGRDSILPGGWRLPGFQRGRVH